MTARETTLGALTAADLGKRVQVGDGEPDVLGWLEVHNPWGHGLCVHARVGMDAIHNASPDTPVTVYDEEEA